MNKNSGTQEHFPIESYNYGKNIMEAGGFSIL